MPKLKSAGHHWWPECVSEHWKDEKGRVHWVRPDGSTEYQPPKNFGLVGNAHHIRLGRVPGEATVWDQSFESAFDRADSSFPKVIEWLEGLDRESRFDRDVAKRFLPQAPPDERILPLVEGLVSLAVRSPMNRERAVAAAEHFRGPIPKHERNALIGMNMRNCQRDVADSIGARGKFAVLYSPDRELIFGDGFFHNIESPAGFMHNPKIVAPITPRIAAVLAKPMRYMTEPKLVTFVLNAEEAEALNHAVQVYAIGAIFYRSERPRLTESYRLGRHQRYSHPDNPIDSFIRRIPGVPPRDKSLDRLLGIDGG